MVTRDIFTHDVSFHCCQGQGYHNIYAELNSTCAEVTSIRKQDSRIYFCNLGPINGSHVKVDKLKYRYYNSHEKCRNALEKGVKQSLTWLFFVAIVNLSKDLLHSTI